MVTIFCALIATLFLAFFTVERISNSLYYQFSSDFYARHHLTTFDLLDDAIAEQQGPDLQATLESIKLRFKYPISLKRRKELNVSAEGMAILEGGGIYLHADHGSSTLHRFSHQSNSVWSMTLEISDYDDHIATVTGPMSLMRDKFIGKDESERALELQKLQRESDAPLSLITLRGLELTDLEISRLLDGQIVGRDTGENGEQYMLLIDDNGPVFRVGPIKYPTSLGYLRILLVLTSVAIILAGCLLWIWPLWSDLKALRGAALAIGGGKLDTRVQTNRPSLIRPVLEGFNHMAIRTENMVASQRELTNAVSHELRTPLARMMFDLEMARQSGGTTDCLRHLDSLDYGVCELKTLVDELLTFAKQERVASQLEFDSVKTSEMHEWLDAQVTRAQRSREDVCCISIKNDMGPADIIQFNTQLMAHAVSNVLQNALRFAENRIYIQLHRDATEWVLSVEDDGIGIPIPERERAFEPFSRIDESRQRGSGGYGLGLSIVRKVARWHQGDACFASCQFLSGARLEIRWPARAQY